jgi:hypothetical protein
MSRLQELKDNYAENEFEFKDIEWLLENVDRLRGALKEIVEYSKHDGISRYLDKCYVVARNALETEEDAE